MKNWTYNIAFKSLCIALATISLVLAAVSAVSVFVMIALRGYEKDYAKICEDEVRSEYIWIANEAAMRYHEYVVLEENEEKFQNFLSTFEKNYGFYLSLRDGVYGEVLYSDLDEIDVLTLEEVISLDGKWVELHGGTYFDTKDYFVTLQIFDPQVGQDKATYFHLLKIAHTYRFETFWVFGLSFVSFFVCIIFLCCAAGREGNEKEIRVNFFDRIPLELYLIFGFFLALIEIAWLESGFPLWLNLCFLGAFFCVDAFLVVLLILTLATRIKSGRFYENTLVFLILTPMIRFVRRSWENARLVPKIAVTLGAVAFFDLFLATILDFTEFLAAVLIEGIVLSGILLWYGASIQELHRDQEKISHGDLDHRLDPSRLPPGLRSFGNSINRSAEGMEKAVEEKMKSERFKTELITNVSHDIKTPLTSIVNYVDLMKKEEITSPRLQEYVEVLERQSLRLKKLTEDLVESSKAASGVLPVNFEPLDLKVLVMQALGEYQTAFEEKGLTLCTTLGEDAVFVLADGKHLWRVLDNLMNNILKYALSGTRVYCTLREEKESAQLVFRNISEKPLILSGAELSERFVRGDASRNTEGSGLGLAIARSLVELQKGKMEIFVDGDLFRVTVSFDKLH